jgi:hypothetical protein
MIIVILKQFKRKNKDYKEFKKISKELMQLRVYMKPKNLLI